VQINNFGRIKLPHPEPIIIDDNQTQALWVVRGYKFNYVWNEGAEE